jgi:hypothetical protein
MFGNALAEPVEGCIGVTEYLLGMEHLSMRSRISEIKIC